MGIIEILGIAGSVSLLAGWRLYLCIFATGAAMRWGPLPLPEHLTALDVLANPWVMGVAALAALIELLTDKIAWLDSAWDAVHTLVRPIGGAMLALAIVDPSDPTTQVIAFILGGAGALASHASKAGTRAVINASPEPVSNLAASLAEDVVIGGSLVLVYAFPAIAALVAVALLALAIYLTLMARRVIRKLLGRKGRGETVPVRTAPVSAGDQDAGPNAGPDAG
ncbi:MAG: DUF4126 domain-containing protein [Tsuneonella suprasediminis]|uniref:DUF4126 domain-containing protein n=1 Tax=Tsuneonella suprasediminis TaxID=2306996 RepID=A0A419QZ15_9SPHN|nr:DUF4126 domain-containing protein [Tsuneonella suprasediminis]RJX65736.1 DUF4126 domain-containing protein [Tsuneonella suprasediminis]UBS33557.1 DUF4126 domain-containing protein [Altererythrobacter sp. N1]